MLKHSETIRAFIKSKESLCLKAVPDPKTGGNPWTIGYGHTGPEVHKGLVWTKEKAEAVLDSDLNLMDNCVNRLLDGCPTTQGQFDAMVSFAFNLGPGDLKTSTLLKLHKAGNFTAAALEFPRWRSPGSKVEHGLLIRRQQEEKIYNG